MSLNFGAVSNKSDVYSFEMLLLDTAGGRKNVDAKAIGRAKFTSHHGFMTILVSEEI